MPDITTTGRLQPASPAPPGPEASGPEVSGAGATGPAWLASAGLRMALLVAVAHGLNDVYAAFLHPLLPRIMGRLELNIALASILATAFSLASSLLQPLAGYLADRYGRRIFAVVGPLASGVFLSAMGMAPSFWVLLALLILGGLGSALFHPPGASYATQGGRGRSRGLRFSVFSFGGAAGFALGPLVAVGAVDRFGLSGLWVAAIPVVVFTPILFLGLPPGRTERRATRPPGPRAVARLLAGPLGLVFGISAVGAFAQRVYLTLTPIIGAGEGATEAQGALALTLYLAGQALGTLTGGYLTDRIDRQRLLQALTAAALPAHLLALGLPVGSGTGMAAAVLAGFCNMALLPPVVVLAQELVPEGAGLGSGIAMGLAWAAGSLLLPLAGAAGDVVGPRPAAMASVALFAVAFALASQRPLRR